MNTEDYLLVENLSFDLDSVDLAELEDEDKAMILTFVETTRFIQEIELLFRVYKSNLSMLLSTYTLYSGDTIIRKLELFGDYWTDYSNINALTISLISAGKTLVEAITVCLKVFLGNSSAEYNDFKQNCLSHEYDTCFGYRLLTRLRDFAQHGHLPVSLIETENGPQACFNLDRIIPTPHFDHNKKLLNELNSIRNDIHNNFGNPAKIAYTLAVAQYNLSLVKIYSVFYKAIQNYFFAMCDNIDILVEKKPEIIIMSDTPLNGMIGYFIDDDASNLHLFNPQDDSRKMFANFSANAETTLAQELKEMENMNSSFRWNTKKQNEG